MLRALQRSAIAVARRTAIGPLPAVAAAVLPRAAVAAVPFRRTFAAQPAAPASPTVRAPPLEIVQPLHAWSRPPGSSIAPAASSSSSSLSAAPILIFSSGAGRLFGLGAAVLLVCVVPSGYLVLQSLLESDDELFQRDLATEKARAAEVGLSEEEVEEYMKPQPRHRQRVAFALLCVLCAGALAGTAIVHRRLISSIHLYPRSRILAVRTSRMIGSARPHLVPLDAVVPPVARLGRTDRVLLRLWVAPAPHISEEVVRAVQQQAAPKDEWTAAIADDPFADSAATAPSSSSSSSRVLHPARWYWLSPLPNDAARLGGNENPAVTAIWSRILGTGLHSQHDINSIASQRQ